MASNKVYVQGNYVDIHDNEVVNLNIDKVGTLQMDEGMQTTEGDETLLTKLSLCFKDEDTARRFLTSIKEMDDTEIVRLVRKYSDSRLCKDTSKALWKLLSEAGLYKTGYPNWNKQMNQR